MDPVCAMYSLFLVPVSLAEWRVCVAYEYLGSPYVSRVVR